MPFQALKVGELARRTGLSIRTLHHYDEIGLIRPSLHTGSGHRLYTAGENKSLLDPFLTEDPKGVERLLALQQDMHESFKELVRRRRNVKLRGEESVLFSGEVFTGRQGRHWVILGSRRK